MAREIFYCNLRVLYEEEVVIVKEVIYKDVDGYYKDNKLFKTPVKVLKIDVIKSLGFENISKEYTSVQKSDEKRNNISGTYE